MSAASQFDIEEALTCQCGCGLTVHSCNHLQCPSGIPLKREIAEQIAAGGSRETILAYFAGKYGEKVLSAPTATGFNLVAWVTPFVAVFVAAALVVMAVRRWRSRSAPAVGAAPAAADPADDERRARLRAELERFDA